MVFALAPRGHTTSAPKTESAYDRVIRTGTLRCGYYIWPPYAELDPKAQKTIGFVPDLVNQLGALLDLKIEYVQMSAMGQQIEDMKRGTYDTTCLDSYVVFSMIKYADFSAPYAYVRADDKRFTKLDQLNNENVTFIGLDGDLSVGLAVHRFPKAKINTLPATSDAAALMINVATKKADVAIIDPGLVDTYNRNNDVKLRALDTAPAVYPVTFSVAKGEDKLVRLLDGGVSALINTGAMDELIKTYSAKGIVLYPVAPGYVVKE